MMITFRAELYVIQVFPRRGSMLVATCTTIRVPIVFQGYRVRVRVGLVVLTL